MSLTDFKYEAKNYDDVENKLGFFVTYLWWGGAAQTISYYQPIFTAHFPCEVYSVSARFSVVNGVAATLGFYRVPSGTAADSATNDAMLVTNYDLQGTVNTTVIKSGLDLTNKRYLNPGDSLAALTTGTLTTIEGVHVTAYLKPLGRGQFR